MNNLLPCFIKLNLFIIAASLLCGCSIDASNNDEPCTHCWVYAGKILTVGNIEYGLQLADDELDMACNENNPNFNNSCANYPDTSKISRSIIRNDIESLIYISAKINRPPNSNDFELCADNNAACVVYYETPGSAGHYAAYEYKTDKLYDNCHCWYGCNNFGDHDYLELFVSYH